MDQYIVIKHWVYGQEGNWLGADFLLLFLRDRPTAHQQQVIYDSTHPSWNSGDRGDIGPLL
jgi:hypothetical protein